MLPEWRNPQELDWLTPPPPQALSAAEELLHRLGALDTGGRITPAGRDMARLPLHPRLSCLVTVAGESGCAAAAILSAGDRLIGKPDHPTLSDMHLLMEQPRNYRTRQLEQQIRRIARPSRLSGSDDERLRKALLQAFPDRVARRRKADLQLSTGDRATLAPFSSVTQAEFLVALDVEERPDQGGALVRLASAFEPEWLLEFFPDRVSETAETRWNNDTRRAERVSALWYDRLLVDESRSPASPEAAAGLLVEQVLRAGIERFVDPDSWGRLQERLAFAAAQGELPPLTDEHIAAAVTAVATGLQSLNELRAALAEGQAEAALLQQLSPNAARILSEVAPEKIRLPERPVRQSRLPAQSATIGRFPPAGLLRSPRNAASRPRACPAGGSPVGAQPSPRSDDHGPRWVLGTTLSAGSPRVIAPLSEALLARESVYFEIAVKYSLALCVCVLAHGQSAPKLGGIWDATVVNAGVTVPFRLEIAAQRGSLVVSFLDGDSKIESTSATFREGKLNAKWDYYDATLDAALESGVLRGHYGRLTRKGPVKMAFSAKPFKPLSIPDSGVAKFGGQWTLKAGDTAGSVWSASFRQVGAEVTGTIQAVDGDFGTLAGTVKGDALTLSHFDAIRSTLLELRLKPEGTLEGTMNGTRPIKGARASEAAAKGIPDPPDPSRYTNVKDPSEPLRFSAPDLTGKVVSAADFRGRVLIVTIMGSWCPNCHDEAPFFEELYKKYKSRGLEVVALAFEYTGEVERDREQVRAFNRRHGVTYTTLLAGTTNDGEVQRVLPQLANFGAFPTSIYAGRDGRVRTVHAGFSGPATGAEFPKLKAELERLVVQLLDEK